MRLNSTQNLRFVIYVNLACVALPQSAAPLLAQQPVEKASFKGEIGTVYAAAFSPNGKTLALGCGDPFWGGPKPMGGAVLLWDVATGKVRATLKGHSFDVKAVAFSKDGKTLASASGDLFTDKPGEVKVWDVPTGKERFTLKGHKALIWSLAFSPDSETLASGSTDRTVKLWDPALGKERATLEVGTSVVALAFSGDGKTLVTAGIASGDDHALKLWDVATRKVRVPLGGRGGENGISAVAFSPDGKTLCSVDRDTRKIELWELTTGKIRATLEGAKEDVWSMAFSKDGDTLAVASGEFLRDKPGTVILWHVPTGKVRATLKGHTRGIFAVAFSPDGELLATGGGGSFVNTQAKMLVEGVAGELKLWKIARDR